jgi:D-xylose transport system substrate-binding protein
MKRFQLFTICLILISAMFFPSCNETKTVKIGFSLGPVHSRWQRDKTFFINQVESLGGKVIFEEAHGDEQKQLEQVKEILNSGVQVLVIAPENSESASEIVSLAKEKGVITIAYDRLIKNCDLDYYISFDNIKVGELQAEYLTKIKPQGNYVLLGGDPKDNNSLLLNLGQMNILQPLIDKGDINLVLDKYVSNWDEKTAYKIMNKFLNKNKDIDAVIASNDPLANGVYKALKENGIDDKVLLSGQDAELEACKRIVEGKQTMTVYKMIESLASTAAKSAVSLAKGETIINTQLTVNNGIKMVPSILLPSMYIVHRDNIRMTVVADGYLDENEIFN